ncbi:hypothetical protein NVS55_24830 [Myxococcus stipitatus]|uniref:hypothetical protein n=1 Tax=Myxococcus stipitatus TaxID=83455 RepID=UPI003145197F
MNTRGNTVHGSALRGLLWALSGVSLLVVAASALIEWFFIRRYEPALDAKKEELAEGLDAYCALQAEVAMDPWFHEARSPGDAGPVLNFWLGWGENHRELPKGSPLHLPAHLHEKKSLQEWFASDVDLSMLDFSWMRDLQRFDRWDLLVNRPIKPADPYDLLNDPSPHMTVLSEWAKFRLIQGIRTGQALEAARDVRHLAWLMYRTDLVDNAKRAAWILDNEQQAHALMKDPPAAWRPQSPEQNARLREAIWTSIDYSRIYTPVAIGRRARACGSGITRCIALVEASNRNRFLQPLLEPFHPQAYAALAEELSTPCGTTLFERVSQRGATLDLAYVMSEEGGWVPIGLQSLPRRYLQKHVAGFVLASEISLAREDLSFWRWPWPGSSAPASAESRP